MKTFPLHLLTRSYTLGTPRPRILDSGVASMRLGNGVLRARDELGQAIVAYDLKLTALPAADADLVDDFYLEHARGVTPFYWAHPLKALTYSVGFDPDTPPQIVPSTEVPGAYDVDVMILPVVPTIAVAMLAAHYKCNDADADTVVVDAGSYGHTGTAARHTAEMTTAGKVGTALAFNGTDDYIAVASTADLNVGTGDFALAFWLKLPGSDHEGQRFINKRSAIDDVGWEIYGRYAAGKDVLGWYCNDGNASITWTLGSTDLAGDIWRHLAVNVTRRGAVEIYVDGQREAAAGMTDCPGSLSNDESLHLGSSTPGTANRMTGSLDDVRLYKRPLTPVEIRAIYNAGSGTEEAIAL